MRATAGFFPPTVRSAALTAHPNTVEALTGKENDATVSAVAFSSVTLASPAGPHPFLPGRPHKKLGPFGQ